MDGDEDPMDGFGVLTEAEGEALAAGIEAAREKMDRDFKERAADLFGR